MVVASKGTLVLQSEPTLSLDSRIFIPVSGIPDIVDILVVEVVIASFIAYSEPQDRGFGSETG